ncbi:hypothetical protein SAMN04489707_10468 [Paenacidovorax caeni]|uniref:Uncharacterized protein n=1 Tax=Paenacidovorax caeni TaxID=343013 RepID=A0A1I7KCN1_9BURK|nr:hypothetical protein SAMN04489707_10468 [Paenacidovorax caeni]
MTYKVLFRVCLKLLLDSFIITNSATSQFAPNRQCIAQATTCLPCRTMV